MAMKSPGHPGRQIKEELSFLDLSVTSAAAGLGVTRHQLQNVIAGRSAITPELAVRLEKGIGGTAEGWLRMQAAHDLAQAKEQAEQITITRLVPGTAALTQ